MKMPNHGLSIFYLEWLIHHSKEPPFMLQVLSYYAFWEYSFYAKIFTYYASPLTHYARIMLDLKLKKQMSYQLRSTQKTKK